MVETTRKRGARPGDRETFVERHNGPREADVRAMLQQLGFDSLDALSDAVVPRSIRLEGKLALGDSTGEPEMFTRLRTMAERNDVRRSFIGLGYYDCVTPAVIQRNILENPGWYTQYTPYQAEIAQGRLEALLNFQTMVADLTGLAVANASLLDEGTAAAEAMAMCRAITRGRRNAFFVADDCHPQTRAVVRARATALGIEVVEGDPAHADWNDGDLFGILLQYPGSEGAVRDYTPVAEAAHAAGARVVMATDLLALTLLRPPGEVGADIAVGSSQRFGVPLGFGGPHAAFLATGEEQRRQIPGRVVGVSRDASGRPAYRLALQTREQHIRRDKATSNICTAQALLAIMASMYALYHGPEGLRRIAERVQRLTRLLGETLGEAGLTVAPGPWFDTLRISLDAEASAAALARAEKRAVNLRRFDGAHDLGISLDETATLEDVALLVEVLGASAPEALEERAAAIAVGFEGPLARQGDYLSHEVFHRYRSEHELLRYIHRLQSRDLSLTHSMIPLGSCTMKLNGTALLAPISWPEFARLHPFAPAEQTAGYRELFGELEAWLAEITGFAAVSLQPNAGAQGEYAGLLVIRAHQAARGESRRDVCLIPESAHGTNPASAVMAGLRVVPVACDQQGNIDVEDLAAKAAKHAEQLAALMITYPSTHGVFEEEVSRVCEIVHRHGGQVYMDGANMNAQVGLCRPGDIGADVCHLNLHKTFCIPHGGGGPGVGPIAVAPHLAPYLPGHPLVDVGGASAIGAVAAAPWGSPGILPISWAYIAMMGEAGLRRATQLAILNANYMAEKLRPHFPVLYTAKNGRVAHEFIIDLRPIKQSAGVSVDDVAKRLMDYGFHAPTMSWPVVGTMMIEPTESESLAELDRFCDAMIRIRAEAAAIERGEIELEQSPLRHAPHTAAAVVDDAWDRAYGRELAAFPAPWVREHKFWPAVARIDNAWGDRNLICSCPPMEAFGESASDDA